MSHVTNDCSESSDSRVRTPECSIGQWPEASQAAAAAGRLALGPGGVYSNSCLTQLQMGVANQGIQRDRRFVIIELATCIDGQT